MKLHPQTIYNGSAAEFVVLPIKEYEQLLELIEDLEDLEIVQEYVAKQGETFPLEFVMSLADGQNRIKAYREYRTMSQQALAVAAGVSKQYISQLENNERAGTTRVLKSIAKALCVELADIMATQ
jgi:DNA-binding XRE family transcriptional regulator